MGNCQAILDAVVIQHTDGRVERLYWPVSAADVMKANPDHHVALVTLSYSEEKDGTTAMKVTRVRLLKSKEVLLLGHVYRLITFQGFQNSIFRSSVWLLDQCKLMAKDLHQKSQWL